VSSARGLAAVLAAGASGAWIGTAFAACPESLASEADRRALIGASGTGTVVTRVFDIAAGYPWPGRYPERVLRNEFWERWAGREDGLRDAVGDATTSGGAAAVPGGTTPAVDAGQGVGSVTVSRPAAEVVDALRSGASTLLDRWGRGPDRP